MIQYWIKDQIAEVFPNLTLTVDYEADAKTFVTVFYEGGTPPGRYDLKTQVLRYMVWVESDDWGYADLLARKIFKHLNEFPDPPVIAVDYIDKFGNILFVESLQLMKIVAQGEPNPLGILEGKRRYSINFDATLLIL